MNHQIPIFIGLLGIGVVIGATLSGNDNTSIADNAKPSTIASESANEQAFLLTSNTTSDTADLEEVRQSLQILQQQLQQEVTKRKQLEKKVALLEKSLDSGISSTSQQDSDTEEPQSDFTGTPHQTGSFGQSANWFNEQAMLDAGVDSGKVNYIKNAFEQAEMDKLYLRDQATREGWLNSERYTDAAREIADRTSALRSQLSEQEYDAYLYAAGRSNRVMVESVLSTSPASNAGIQPGDTILKYDNKRIYSWTDLTSATSEGTPNDTVSVTIERNGQTQQVYLPRGPLGVRLATDSVAP